MATKKPTKLMAGFGLNTETVRDMAAQQRALMDPVPDGMYEVRIITASVFTKSADGEPHKFPALGVMFGFLTEKGQKGSSYLQFRPKEGGTAEEIKEALRLFGLKMSALFGATGVDLEATMNDKNWTPDERQEGRKPIVDMKGVCIRLVVEFNSFMNPKDGQTRGYNLKFITQMPQPVAAPVSIFKKGIEGDPDTK